MPFTPQVLRERLRELAADGGAASRYLVAFSGGIDSAALLHALVEVAGETPVIAVHADHGLQPDSRRWDAACGDFARSHNVAYLSRRLAIAEPGGLGVEAAAREARYAFFRTLMQAGDWLMSAHHQDDQAETLLLNLLRGSGMLGLAGIARRREFADGVLVRPLLDVSRSDIEAYARLENLDWTEDPSNRDCRFDRNFLRNEIMPRLRTRWPALGSRLARSAELAGEAELLLGELAAFDLAGAGRPDRLELGALRLLASARRRNLLRYAIRSLGLAPAPYTRLHRIAHELVDARPDAAPLVAWDGAQARRYRDHVFLLAAAAPLEASPAPLRPGSAVELGHGQGRLSLQPVAGPGIAPAIAEAGLSVCYRQGGERLKLHEDGRTQRLKTLLQDAGVLPWMRPRIPLLMAEGKLAAVADLWIDADASAEGGYVVRWHEGPVIT